MFDATSHHHDLRHDNNHDSLDRPICAAGQQRVYGVARGEVIIMIMMLVMVIIMIMVIIIIMVIIMIMVIKKDHGNHYDH